LAEKLKERYPNFYKVDDNGDWVERSAINAFAWSIHSAAWAPDSRTLAFAAQIDGISSDVYQYHLETGTIHRVEDSLQSVSRIRWSPDGKYIVFNNSQPGPVYEGETLHAVKPGSQVTQEPISLYSGTWLFVGDWLSPDILLVADGTDTAGNFNLQALNINTGQLKDLWRNAVNNYAIDHKNQTIAINTSEFAKPETQGLYFVTFSGKQRKILDGIYYLELFFRGGGKHRFLVQGVGGDSKADTVHLAGDVVGIDLNGKQDLLGKFDYDKISISPDQVWLLMYDQANLYLYDTNDELIKTFPIPDIQKIIWRPDSHAIFYLANKELYTLLLPVGKPELVDKCNLSDCPLDDAVWLP